MVETLIAGFGFRDAATTASLMNALESHEKIADISGIAAPADKCRHSALKALAHQLHVPVYPIDPADLEAKVTPSQSEAVLAARGTGSVAEASALIAAGASATLISERQISKDRLAVCAIAKGVKL